MELDYTIKDPEMRVQQVEWVIAEMQKSNPNALTPQYLSYLSDYILFTSDASQTKKEKQENHPIVTKNREVTTKKREVSYEEIVSTLENGEDGIYNMMLNDKNRIMDYKDPINDKDIAEIPGVKEHLNIIKTLQAKLPTAKGRSKYLIKKQIIETYQQIYIIKEAYKGAPARGKISNQAKNFAHMALEDRIYLDEDDMPQNAGVLSLFNPTHISFLLCHYSELKQECHEDLNADMRFLLIDLENLVSRTLLPHDELFFDLVCWKIDGLTNQQIQERMIERYNVKHSEQYYSNLWRKRIPKMIAEQASKEYIIWYYKHQATEEMWKTCNKCGHKKPAHPLFFSRNNSKDKFYSVCRDCRKKS